MYIQSLNLIRVGSTFCNRIGRKINMTSLHIRLYLAPIRTQAVNGDVARIMLVYDRQTNGAYPVIADILQSTDQATANTVSVISGVNLNNRDRFQILRDEFIPLPTLTFTAGVITNQGFVDPIAPLTKTDWYVKLNGMITQYKADSAPAVIGDISTGGLYLVSFAAAANGAEGWSAQFENRLRYTDG